MSYRQPNTLFCEADVLDIINYRPGITLKGIRTYLECEKGIKTSEEQIEREIQYLMGVDMLIKTVTDNPEDTRVAMIQR